MVRGPVHVVAHAHLGQGLGHAVLNLVRRQAHVQRPERYVIEDPGREELVVRVLEHQSHQRPDALEMWFAHV